MLSEKQIETVPANIINALKGLSVLESIAMLEIVKFNLLKGDIK